MTDTAVAGSGAGVHYSPYDYAVHEDPYPTYARLRAEAPLYRNDEFDFWALSRHADVLAAFRDPAHLSNRFGVTLDPAAYGPHAHKSMSFLAMDPPRHTRMRSLVSKAFTTRRVAELEPEIRALAVAYLDAAVEMGSFDMVGDVAGKLPMDVISQMIGVPAPDRAEVRRLADLLVHREEGVFDVPRQGMEAALVLAGYFADMVTGRRRSRRDDLTSGLIDADIDGDRLSDDEIISFLFLMVVAGQRDHHEAPRQRLVLGLAIPRREDQSPARRGARPGLGGRDPALRHLLADAAAGHDGDVSSSSARCSTTASACSCSSGRPIATPRCSPTPTVTTWTVTPPSSSASAEDGISAWVPPWPGSKHASCSKSSWAGCRTTTSMRSGARRVHSINVRGFAALPTTVTAR